MSHSKYHLQLMRHMNALWLYFHYLGHKLYVESHSVNWIRLSGILLTQKAADNLLSSYLMRSKLIQQKFLQGCTEFDFFKFGRSQIWPDFRTQIRPQPEPSLAETCFLVTEQYASDKSNGVNNAVSRYRGSTLQCFLCCVTVCQLFLI